MPNKKKTQSRASKHKRLKSEIILDFINQKDEPVATREIAQILGQGGKQGIEVTYNLLVELRDSGKIAQIKRNRWGQASQIKELEGRVVGHAEGHGHIIPTGGGEKIYLRSHDMQEVLHGDIVTVRITGRDKRKKRLGQIIEIIERANQTIVGRFFFERGLGFVVPNDQRISQDIFISPESIKSIEIESGQVVLCKITKQPSKHFQPVGEIKKILGDYLAPGMEIEIAKNEFDIPSEWPTGIAKETDKLPESVNGDDFPNRTDLRQLPLVTIDGEDARDFDDAVFCQKYDDHFRLVVAIADVSHYVKQNTALDDEAWQRGNSVYFPRQVIPMLPEVLSNGLCSLNPQVDRLSMVCDMEISTKGEIIRFEFYPAVIHSHARLTYEQVSQFLDTEQADILPIKINPEQVIHSLTTLADLANILGEKRRKYGSVDLDIAEPVIVFDENRKIKNIISRERNQAHRLIEECMLIANICAADTLEQSNIAGIYRIHEHPDDDKVEEMRQFIRQFGVILGGGAQPQALDYSKLINQLDQETNQKKIIHQALLRSFKQARYSEENSGHFALAFNSYTHFTSPIRRYSDLHVHRQLKRLINDPSTKDDDQAIERVISMAEQTSMTERRAEKATREVVQWLKCEYMSHKIGEQFSGTIITVVDFGMFVELDALYVEGLVHIANLGDDYFIYDDVSRILRGENSSQSYRAGQKIDVVVARVDLQQKRIDFDLANKKLLKHKKVKNIKKHGKRRKKR